MGQEYFINSQELENKIRTLLPSQGGAGAGFDLSASTQIIPVIDVTESAEGSNLRQDLQSSLSLSSVTAFEVSNASASIVTNTGYFRVFGVATLVSNTGGSENVKFSITDGATTKNVYKIQIPDTNIAFTTTPFDFIVFLQAGDSLLAETTNASNFLVGCTRQIANIAGELRNP